MVSLNSLDVLLLLILLVIAVWASLQGIARLLIVVFSLYVALVVALLLYQPLADFFRRLMSAFSIVGSQALAFALILFVVFNGLNYLARFATTPAEERRRRSGRPSGVPEAAPVRTLMQRFVWGPLNTLVSFVVGLIVSLVTLSLILAVVQHVVQTDAVVVGASAGLRQQMKTSALLPMFNVALILAYRAVSIWLPGSDVPAIFTKILKP